MTSCQALNIPVKSQGIATSSMLAELLERNDARGGLTGVEDAIKAVSATSYAGRVT